MKQSHAMSLVESVANVIVGYGVAVVKQILIFPIFELHTTQFKVRGGQPCNAGQPSWYSWASCQTRSIWKGRR